MRLEKSTGNANLYPDYKAPSQISNGEADYTLSTAEKLEYKQNTDSLTEAYRKAMISNDAYDDMSATEKVDALMDAYSYAQDQAKRQYIESKGGTYDEPSAYSSIYKAEKAGIGVDSYLAYKNYLSKIDTDGSSSTQLQKTQAIEKTDLTQQLKGELWAVQNSDSNPDKNPYTGSLAQQGLAPEKNIEIMAARKQYTKKAEFVAWLSSVGYNDAQIAAIWAVYKNG